LEVQKGKFQQLEVQLYPRHYTVESERLLLQHCDAFSNVRNGLLKCLVVYEDSSVSS